MNSVYNWFGGRSTAFALWFFIIGTILAFQNKLSVNYIALAGALQTLIATRSIAGDHHERSKVEIIPGRMGPPGVPGPPGKDGENPRFTVLRVQDIPGQFVEPGSPQWHDS